MLALLRIAFRNVLVHREHGLLLVLVISMVPVAKVPTDGLGTQLGLALLHLVAAVCITVPLVRAGKSLPAPAGSSA